MKHRKQILHICVKAKAYLTKYITKPQLYLCIISLELDAEEVEYSEYAAYKQYLRDNRPSPTLHPELFKHKCYTATSSVWWKTSKCRKLSFIDDAKIVNGQRILFLDILIKQLSS